MDIAYRKAVRDDLEKILDLTVKATEEMERNGIHQWDSIYPCAEDFTDDIESGSSYVGTADGKIVVVYAVNSECDEQYANACWQYTGDDFIVIHRLCVSPDFQNHGIAKATLRHIEREASSAGKRAVRLDVFSENPYAVRLYSNNGYHRTGTARWRKGLFLLMEKLLES